MPSLEEILKKTKAKSERVAVVHKPPSIATADRPYSDSIFTSNKEMNSNIFNDTPSPSLFINKIVTTEIYPPVPTDSVSNAQAATNPIHKGDTKGLQKEHKGGTNTVDHLLLSIKQEEKHKGNTKGLQRDYKEGNTKGLQKEHIENKGDTKGTLKGTHKGLQREHKNLAQNTALMGTQREHKYSHLRGWNKKIVDLIHDICRETVSKVTYPLTNNAISEMLNMPRDSVKTTMQRLKLKGHVIVADFNDGRGGWSKYSLPDEFFNDIPQTERVLNITVKGTQRDYKGNTKGNTQGDTNNSCSSSSKDLKTTTTELSDEWNFDIAPYAQFGFTKTQIKQLAASGVISSSDVEQSLIEFSFDIENNALPKIKTTKINFLMGLLWKGQSYVSEGFKNEQDAMIAEMASRASRKRESLLNAKFEAWASDLSNEERITIEKKLPTHLIVLYRAHGISNTEVKGWMLEYYKQNG